MDTQKIIDSLSPHERKILPYLEEKSLAELCKKSNLDKTSVIRALGYLENKGLVKLSEEKKKVVDVGVNGALYRKKGLPERRFLHILNERKIIPLKDIGKSTGLTEDELKASLGALKKKAVIEIKNNKVILSARTEEIIRKTIEEIFLDSLPLDFDSLTSEQRYAFESLKSRKDIVLVEEEKTVTFRPTEIGKTLTKTHIKSEDMIEQITPELLKDEKVWRRKKFRRYDVALPVPALYGGKRHFVNQSIDYAKNIWLEMSFKEMTGNLVQPSFWNFDALFTAQDHPVREMQDTFFLNKKGSLPDAKIVKAVKQAHEKGLGDSKGWGYDWDEEEAKTLVLRTHTTALSSVRLASLKKEDLPAKFFAIGKCFRNETVDWSHGFEFNQTEGIVIDENANFVNLLGYLKIFFKKMGFEKIRFSPAYFPYTEPSVEIHAWHPERKVWLELGGAGIFRPEVTIPLLGKHIPILAWGPGFDRILMDYYEIKDLRELYGNDLSKIRKMKFWMK